MDNSNTAVSGLKFGRVTGGGQKVCQGRLRDYNSGGLGKVSEIQQAESAVGLPLSSGAPEFDHSAFIIAYTIENLGHVIYPSGVSEADWLHDLSQLAKETWTGH
jgi:hypothetical protein